MSCGGNALVLDVGMMWYGTDRKRVISVRSWRDDVPCPRLDFYDREAVSN